MTSQSKRAKRASHASRACQTNQSGRADQARLAEPPQLPQLAQLQKMAAVAENFLHLPEVAGVSFPASLDKSFSCPDEAGCLDLWEKYGMPDHIRRHSRQVTNVMLGVGELARQRGRDLHPPYLLAGGLLHDISKIYTIRHGGDHAQVGAALIMRETRNPVVAQMVYHHVGWPWRADIDNDHALHMLLASYADKRVRHDQVVTLEERFADLFQRYGSTDRSRNMLAHAYLQARDIENKLSKQLEVSLHEHFIDCGRLVKRA